MYPIYCQIVAAALYHHSSWLELPYLCRLKLFLIMEEKMLKRPRAAPWQIKGRTGLKCKGVPVCCQFQIKDYVTNKFQLPGFVCSRGIFIQDTRTPCVIFTCNVNKWNHIAIVLELLYPLVTMGCALQTTRGLFCCYSGFGFRIGAFELTWNGPNHGFSLCSNFYFYFFRLMKITLEKKDYFLSCFNRTHATTLL